MKKNILVDADGLPYIAGGTGNERWYTAVFEDAEGELSSIRVGSAAEVKAHGIENKLTLIDRELEIIPQPLAFALQICKTKIKDMMNRYQGDLYLYIKGDGTNWRDDVATIVGYKANRINTPKPPWNKEIYAYLRDHWNAVEISGKEVDDHVATLAFESSKPYVICSPDKDLDQIPGTHWNYAKNVEYQISPDEARAFFWAQALAGDNADNIKGCWKIGVQGATEMVDEWIAEGMSDAELWECVVSEYAASQDKKGCPYTVLTAEEAALENARLVWMQTESGRLWTPPHRPLEYMNKATLDD